jgi:LmbE family N-acetylglucosaminyl deacetylase
LIHQLTRDGQRVVVRTFLAADPPPNLSDTPLIRALHHKWEAGSSPYETRRREDIAALQSLGVAWEHLDLLDAPYRTNDSGDALYPLQASIFGDIHPDDPLLTLDMDVPQSVAMIYAPLGAGDHIDHRLVNRLARTLPAALNVVYYEDFPYSSEGDEIAYASRNRAEQPYGNDAIQSALQRFERPLLPRLIDLSEADIAAKIDAIRCYRSQLGTFWKDEAEMQAGVRRYARQVAATGAERLWIQGETL